MTDDLDALGQKHVTNFHGTFPAHIMPHKKTKAMLINLEYGCIRQTNTTLGSNLNFKCHFVLVFPIKHLTMLFNCSYLRIFF